MVSSCFVPFDDFFSSKGKVKAQPPPKPAPSLAEGVTRMKQKAAMRLSVTADCEMLLLRDC
jgi:hypothetical protein